jgi:hypothetical protein
MLESASPVLTGRVLDSDTHLPIGGATIVGTAHRNEVTTAADGSFVVPVTPPLFRRLILILDRSGSMKSSLDPKDDEDAPIGQQRIDVLRKAVHGLLDQIPPGTGVALWSFTTPFCERRCYFDYCSAEFTTVEQDFGTSLDTIGTTVEKMQPEGGTPLTGAVDKVLDHVADNPASRDAVVVLLTDGVNSCEDPEKTPAKVYEQKKGSVVIHTVGFAIEPGGQAEKDLKELAQVSGGTYSLAGTQEELALTFKSLGDSLADVRGEVSAQGYYTDSLVVPVADLGQGPLTLNLSRSVEASFLTIKHDNVQDLDLLKELSPKAKRMIQDRVSDARWHVVIPRTRVGVGNITAYAWFEMEEATGRIVGRTEDGLHGSVVGIEAGGGAQEAAEAFLAWYAGIVAYTSGSVYGALTWHSDPNFLGGTSEDFARFVQANGLSVAMRWWDEVGSERHEGKAGPYVLGVCTNFGMQSIALRFGDIASLEQCFRLAAVAVCQDAESMLKDEVEGWALDGLPGQQIAENSKEFLAEEFGPVLSTLAEQACAKGSIPPCGEINAARDAVMSGSLCPRFAP